MAALLKILFSVLAISAFTFALPLDENNRPKGPYEIVSTEDGEYYVTPYIPDENDLETTTQEIQSSNEKFGLIEDILRELLEDVGILQILQEKGNAVSTEDTKKEKEEKDKKEETEEKGKNEGNEEKDNKEDSTEANNSETSEHSNE